MTLRWNLGAEEALIAIHRSAPGPAFARLARVLIALEDHARGFEAMEPGVVVKPDRADAAVIDPPMGDCRLLVLEADPPNRIALAWRLYEDGSDDVHIVALGYGPT